MNEKFLASSPSAVIESTAEQMGFQPVESAVVVALVGRTVAFCARMDLVDAVEASTSVTPALDSTGADGVLLVGYSQRPEWAAGVLHTLASGVLDGLVITQHVTDEKTAWRCDGGQLLDGEPFTAPLPQASRDDVVAAVTAERQPTALDAAMGRIAALDSMQRTLALTAALACDPSPEQAEPEPPRLRKFRRMCDDAWNRLTKARDVDVKPDHAPPAPHTTAGQFALGIGEHRARLTDPTDLDDALWAALTHARDRARRSRETTKAWQSAPVLTTQLIDAVAEHRRLNPEPRPADMGLYGLLRG